jgi:hypothetical protein
LGDYEEIYPVNEEQTKKYKRFLQYAHEMEGLTIINNIGISNASTIISTEKKAELQKQLMKTYQLQPTDSLRKNSSAKLSNKGRESGPSHFKSSKPHNLSSDKLDAALDNSVDSKQKQGKTELDRPRSKNKKLNLERPYDKSESIPEEVYLFSNDNLKDIASLPPQ